MLPKLQEVVQDLEGAKDTVEADSNLEKMLHGGAGSGRAGVGTCAV